MKKILWLMMLLSALAFASYDTTELGGSICGMCYVSTGGTQTINTGGTFEKIDEGTIAYIAGGGLSHFTHSDGRLTYTNGDSSCVHINCNVGIELSLIHI